MTNGLHISTFDSKQQTILYNYACIGNYLLKCIYVYYTISSYTDLYTCSWDYHDVGMCT